MEAQWGGQQWGSLVPRIETHVDPTRFPSKAPGPFDPRTRVSWKLSLVLSELSPLELSLLSQRSCTGPF